MQLSRIQGHDPDLDARCHEVIGTPVTFLSPEELMGEFGRLIETDEHALVFHQNLHGVYLQQQDPSYLELYQACDFAYADGMPLVWLARIAGHRVDRSMRATWLDWEQRFLDDCARNSWRVFYIGGTEDSLVAGIESLRAKHPGLEIEGHHGFFDHDPQSADSLAVVDAANAFDASLVFVGMGMPLQERWASEQRSRLTAPVVLAIGAGLDYASGAISSPPRWAGRLGLEWLYRLAAEPRRLGYRYLVEPFRLLSSALRSSMRRSRS